MKIGVLTYHCVPNFGAQLQATSTVGYLKRLGHNPVVLNWYPTDLEEMYAKRVPREQIEAHNAYTLRMLPVTDLCRTEDELLHIINKNDLDAIVVGSDALFKYVPIRFRRKFSKRRLHFISCEVTSSEKLEANPFFGGFVDRLGKKIPVAAFSVSSQNCSYFAMSKKEKEQMRLAMRNFSTITVRDEWTKGMVETIMNITDVLITPDPVFSFNQNFYKDIPTRDEILAKYNLAQKYLLISFRTNHISDSYINQLAVEAEHHGLMPIAFPMPEGLRNGDIKKRIMLPLDPLDWYALIKYSSGYVGERMHPIVVCIHNDVPFFSFDEYGTFKKGVLGLNKHFVQTSSKTYRILERADLSKWYFSYFGNLTPLSPEEVINRVLSFDHDKCRYFSNSYQKSYERTMKDTISKLQ